MKKKLEKSKKASKQITVLVLVRVACHSEINVFTANILSEIKVAILCALQTVRLKQLTVLLMQN